MTLDSISIPQQPASKLFESLNLDPQSKELIRKILEQDAHSERSMFDTLSDHERIFVIDTIHEVSKGQYTNLNKLWEVDYARPIPSVKEFLESDYYIGHYCYPKDDPNTGLYGSWREELEVVLNPDNRLLEVLVQASPGAGKTTFADIAMAYWLCKALCLKNPQKFYSLMPRTTIIFFIFNLTLGLGFDRCYSTFYDIVSPSPFFKEYIQPSRADMDLKFPNGIKIEVGSRIGHTLGGAVFFALLDEANFSPYEGMESELSQVMKSYHSLLSRMTSRFIRAGGVVDGQLFMLSSQSDKNAALNKHIEKTKKSGAKTSIVIEKNIYEVKRTRRGSLLYNGETFAVLVGDQFMDSRILTKGEPLPTVGGYRIIDDIPIEYKELFDKDLHQALIDVCNISSSPIIKLIRNKEKLRDSIDFYRKSPFKVETIILDFNNEDEIKDFLDMDFFRLYMQNVPPTEFAIHTDTGLTGDALGMSMSHSSGSTVVEDTDLTGQKFVEHRVLMTNDFTIRIKNVEGKEIPLFKVVRFILWLRNEFGITFSMASCDGFQYSALLQLLRLQNITCKVLSIDRDDIPGLSVKSAIYDGRVFMYNYPPLISELLDLDHFPSKKKIDHPAGGQKDTADAFIGSLYSLIESSAAAVKEYGAGNAGDLILSQTELRRLMNKRITQQNLEDANLA